MKNIILMMVFLFPLYSYSQNSELAEEKLQQSNHHSSNHHQPTNHQPAQHNSGDHSNFKNWKISFALSQSFIPSYHLHNEVESSQLIPTDGIELSYFLTTKFLLNGLMKLNF
jgi:hypothetical protein